MRSSAALPGVTPTADLLVRLAPARFVQVDAAGATLTWPDYRGNRFFNTMGNIALQPRTGLLFIDFARGDLLHVAGDAEVLWPSHEQRQVRLHVREWRLRRGAWPCRALQT